MLSFQLTLVMIFCLLDVSHSPFPLSSGLYLQIPHYPKFFHQIVPFLLSCVAIKFFCLRRHSGPIHHLVPEVRDQRSEIRDQRSEIRRSEVRDQRSEVRDPEIRGQRSEVRSLRMNDSGCLSMDPSILPTSEHLEVRHLWSF